MLEKKFDPVVKDHNGDTALHLAAIHGCPMSAFNLTKAAPVTCLTRNQKQQRPADVAKACERGEVASIPCLLALTLYIVLDYAGELAPLTAYSQRHISLRFAKIAVVHEVKL